METLRDREEEFIGTGGYGSGHGSGHGSGYGDGSGDGSSYGRGSSYGYGHGSGHGSGYGHGHGSGYGHGHGSGSGRGISSINGRPVYYIDGVLTVISNVHGQIARGWILHNDMTMQPCYVAKSGGVFAHGDTPREAMQALRDKLLEGMPVADRIEAFLREHTTTDPYPNRDLFEWHHRLTGSCLAGRLAFARNHGIDVETGSMTVAEFISLTKDEYGGDVIRELEKRVRGITG